jgi:hypothetical protein
MGVEMKGLRQRQLDAVTRFPGSLDPDVISGRSRIFEGSAVDFDQSLRPPKKEKGRTPLPGGSAP